MGRRLNWRNVGLVVWSGVCLSLETKRDFSLVVRETNFDDLGDGASVGGRCASLHFSASLSSLMSSSRDLI